MKLMKKTLNYENGQVLVLVALLMVILIGFTGVIVDVGVMQMTKANLQNAADAAAIAGAQKLPNKTTAENTAKDYAELNGAEKSKTIVSTPYNGDSNMIEVVCTKNVPFSFAKVLGFNDRDVSARAVAKKDLIWAGEALPFLNLDDDYTQVPPNIVAWEKTGPGDFESIWKSDYTLHFQDDPSKTYFTVDYSDGIIVTKGEVATIKQEVKAICLQHKPVYLFSLRNDVMADYATGIKNKDNIPVEDMVLLQVTFNNCDEDKTNDLLVTGVFDFNAGVFPTDFLSADSNSVSGLVE